MEVQCHSKYISWIKRFILIAGIIPMLALTINDLIPILNDYKDSEKNVLTQVSIEVNKSIPRPNITVCILPYWSYSPALDTIVAWLAARDRYPNSTPPEAFMALKNHSWDDVWNMNGTILNEGVDVVDTIQDDTVAKIVKRIIAMSEDDQLVALNGKNGFDWNQPIIDAVWTYLVRVIDLDRYLTPPGVPYDISGDMQSGLGAVLAQVGQVSNKQMDQLFVRVLEAILPGYYFAYEHKVPSASIGIMEQGIGFCLQPDTSDSVVPTNGSDDGYRSFSFQFRSHNTSGRVLRVFEDPSTMYSSIPNTFDLQRPYVAEAAGINSVRMELTYSVESRFIENRTDRVCSNDLSSEICFANHQVNMTIEHCQCIPFAYRFLRNNPDNLSYCHLIHYESCHERLMEIEKKNTDYCSRKCEYTFYRWNPTTMSEESDDPTVTRFHLTITPTQVTPYLEFKTVDKINLHEFFSQLGGSVGFYLGFSCLTGFGIFGLLVEFIIKRFEARKGPGDTTGNGKNSVWTFLWTKNFLNILANRAEDDKRRKMEGMREEVNELKKETSQLRELVDHERIENEKRDKIRCQKMDEMDKKMDETNRKMGEVDKRMENLSKEFMLQLEVIMKMLVQLKKDTETL